MSNKRWRTVAGSLAPSAALLAVAVLGLALDTYWQYVLAISISAAATGGALAMLVSYARCITIATGAMLAIARVSGETAPLLFTAFGSRFFPRNLNEPIASLTVQIYNYAISPYDEWHTQAWAATLVLMALILSINIAVRFLTRNRFS